MTRTEQIDRAAWSKLLAELQAASGQTDEQLAALAGRDVRTIYKWINGEVSATPESIRNVARGCGYSPARALAEVGFLTTGEVGIAGLQGSALDPLAAELNKLLKEPRFPVAARAVLRRMLGQQLANWLDMYRSGPGPEEPALRRPGARSRRGGE